MPVSRPLVTDEWPDRVWGRPVARLLVRLFVLTPLTANQCTVLAAGVGIAAGLFLCLGEGIGFALAALLFLALDCADGQLARLGRGGGILGRLVDGIGDYVTAIAIHLGLIAWIARSQPLGIAVAWGAGAGLSMAWSSFLLDKYKRRYRGDVDDLAAVRQEAQQAQGLRRALFRVFLPYALRLNNGDRIPDREAYRARVRLPMLLWLQQGPTFHLVLLAILAVLGRPLLYAAVAVGPLNLVAAGTLALQHLLERRPPAVIVPHRGGA